MRIVMYAKGLPLRRPAPLFTGLLVYAISLRRTSPINPSVPEPNNAIELGSGVTTGSVGVLTVHTPGSLVICPKLVGQPRSGHRSHRQQNSRLDRSGRASSHEHGYICVCKIQVPCCYVTKSVSNEAEVRGRRISLRDSVDTVRKAERFRSEISIVVWTKRCGYCERTGDAAFGGTGGIATQAIKRIACIGVGRIS